jgi:chaperonin cofactor prefoldin
MPELDMQQIISDLNTRIRTLEAKYTNLGERLLIVNQNMISEYKHIHKELRTFDTDIKDIKHSLFQIKEVLQDITKELGKFAKKEHIKVLEKYINVWNPINFVTEEDVIRILEKQKKDVKPEKKGKKKG